jgi:aspartate/methionine/tyrosine aminotransferase
LRDAIVKHYRRSYAVSISPDNVFVTTGSSAAFQLACLASFEQGDRVALAAPGYPAYRHILSSLGLLPHLIPTGEESNYQLTVDLVKASKQPIDGLVIASPSNPTGTMIADIELRNLVQYCEDSGIRVISDEIYHGITYESSAATAFTVDNSSIVINSFSKYFGMTGWRVGWLVVPQDLIRSIECLAQNHYICPPAISQVAALSVIDATEQLDEYVVQYKNNRDLMLNTLPKIGFNKIAPSDGAFYLYVDVSHITNDSVSYCHSLLMNRGVALTPGVDFDPDHGRHFVRISYAGSEQDIEDALFRLSK